MAIREIKRTALVTFTPEQMFDLVVDVERYPRIPALGRRGRGPRKDRSANCSRACAWSAPACARQFTTRNVMERPDWHVADARATGRSRRLDGLWTFAAIGTAGTRVELVMKFEFANPVIVAAVRQGVRGRASAQLIDAFVVRARSIHGQRLSAERATARSTDDHRSRLCVAGAPDVVTDSRLPPEGLTARRGHRALRTARCVIRSCERAPLVIGVFGAICEPSRPLRAGDRVEIYRPLRNDPREHATRPGRERAARKSQPASGEADATGSDRACLATHCPRAAGSVIRVARARCVAAARCSVGGSAGGSAALASEASCAFALALFGMSAGRSSFSTLLTLSPSKYTTKCARSDLRIAAARQRVDVIPALRIERVGDHRRAEQVAHLAARHAGRDLVDVCRLEQVALLDVRSVDATARAEAAPSASSEEQNERACGLPFMSDGFMLSGVTGTGR